MAVLTRGKILHPSAKRLSLKHRLLFGEKDCSKKPVWHGVRLSSGRQVHGLREARLHEPEQLPAIEVVLRVVHRLAGEPHPRRPDVLAAVQRLQIFRLVPDGRGATSSSASTSATAAFPRFSTSARSHRELWTEEQVAQRVQHDLRQRHRRRMVVSMLLVLRARLWNGRPEEGAPVWVLENVRNQAGQKTHAVQHLRKWNESCVIIILL